MVGTYTPLSHFVRMARKEGLTDTRFHTVSFVGSEVFAKQLLSFEDGTEENVYVTQVTPSPYDESNETVLEFRTMYASDYPGEDPNYVALEGFINAKILTTALSRAGRNLTRERLVQTLENMSDYDAGTGLPSGISARNHSFFNRVFISEIRNGRFTVFDHRNGNP